MHGKALGQRDQAFQHQQAAPAPDADFFGSGPLVDRAAAHDFDIPGLENGAYRFAGLEHEADRARAGALAAAIERRDGFDLVGVMFYDAQIAGLPDTSPAVRLVKKRSAADLLGRRAAVVAAVADHAKLEIVNAGGTGSLEVTGADPAITELTAGSGLFSPVLFDGYDAFESRPAAYFVLSVVRKPAPDIATLFAGGLEPRKVMATEIDNDIDASVVGHAAGVVSQQRVLGRIWLTAV